MTIFVFLGAHSCEYRKAYCRHNGNRSGEGGGRVPTSDGLFFCIRLFLLFHGVHVLCIYSENVVFEEGGFEVGVVQESVHVLVLARREFNHYVLRLYFDVVSFFIFHVLFLCEHETTLVKLSSDLVQVDWLMRSRFGEDSDIVKQLVKPFNVIFAQPNRLGLVIDHLRLSFRAADAMYLLPHNPIPFAVFGIPMTV